MHPTVRFLSSPAPGALEGLGFTVGIRVLGLGFRVQALGIRVGSWVARSTVLTIGSMKFSLFIELCMVNCS